jgi:cytochrome c peroxidase
MPKSSRHSRRLPFLILAFLALFDPRASAGGRREVDYPESLKGQWVPRPTRLSDFVADGEALVTLGKSLFWDVGIGSDGQTACATCHGHAGVDPRRINTVHPGANGTFDTKTAAGELKTADFFPTTVFADPASRFSEVLRDLDDIAGSQGVLSRRFVGLDSGRIEEICDALPEAIFVLDGVAQRQVTGRNPPTVINAVFNIRNFWDGRANPWFNGRNGLGPVDPAARVWVANAAGTGLVPAAVMLDFSSLASQAVGPVLNPVEMSCAGRAWPDLAAKLLDRQPLATQRVRPDDSVLGPLVDADGLGLEVTYRELVDAAFLPHWRTSLPTPDGVPQVEANFPLIFGLAVQAYEARLVSDETRYDRFAEAGFPEDGGGFLDAEERRGLAIFMNQGELDGVPVGRCVACHSGPLFASPTWPAVGVNGPPPGSAPHPAPDGIERMLAMAGTRSARVTFADAEFDGDPRTRPLDFPIAGADLEIVRVPDGGDEVLDGEFPEEAELPCPGSSAFSLDADEGTGTLLVEIRRELVKGGGCATWIRFSLEEFPVGQYRLMIDDELRATLEVHSPGAYDQGFYNIGVRPTAEDLGIGGFQAGGVPLSWTRRRQSGLPLPEVANPTAVPAGVHAAVNGAFKTPTLRNVELTGPYFHNGGQATLRQTVEFYNRGGDFHEANLTDLSPEMESLGLSDGDIEALVAFMKTLTDERVRDERAPFDHPELPLSNGTTLPAVGAKGRAALCLPPLRSFEERLAGGDEPDSGDATDCDGNGVPDACEEQADEDGDGVPDPCERAAGDFNLDGQVGSADLAWLLAVWGSTLPGWSFADLDRDGQIGSSDLTLLLSRWGPVD